MRRDQAHKRKKPRSSTYSRSFGSRNAISSRVTLNNQTVSL
jgi:hypothetical protein